MLLPPIENLSEPSNVVSFFGTPNKRGCIDRSFLKNEYETGRLQGAHSFAELFQIRSNSRFKQDAKFHFDFIEWEISIRDWDFLICFLKHGQLLHNRIQDIEQLNTLCNKLGGIPSFDKYFAKILQKENTIADPSEDNCNEFDWLFVPYYQATLLLSYYKLGWSVTKTQTRAYSTTVPSTVAVLKRIKTNTAVQNDST